MKLFFVKYSNYMLKLFSFNSTSKSVVKTSHRNRTPVMQTKLSTRLPKAAPLVLKARKKMFLRRNLKAKNAVLQDKRKLVLSFLAKRSFFWAISFFSRLHLVLWKIRFVIWLNYFNLYRSSATIALFTGLSYEFPIAYSNNSIVNIFSSRNLFFNRALSLWRFKTLDWLDIEFSAATSLRDTFTKYKRIVWSPLSTLRFTYNMYLSEIYSEKYLIGKWFATNRLPKYLRTAATDAQWKQSVDRSRLVKSDMRFIQKRIKRQQYKMIYPTNIFIKLF